MPPKRKKIPKKKRKQTRKLANILVSVGLILAFAILCLYFVIDYKVESRLNKRSSFSVPAILSDATRIHANLRLNQNDLLQQLNRRSYRQVSDLPQKAGQFRNLANEISIFTRSFYNYEGQQVRPELVTIRFQDNQIDSIRTQSNKQSFYLEPEVVANLISGEVKARRYKSLNEIPKSLQMAVVSVEDERFYQHFGIDIFGILRALATNILHMRVIQGGSTLTQQLAKNLLFTPKRSIKRKVFEALAALSIEQRLTKDEILEMYLNEVFFGQESSVAFHGVQQAADTFFGKNVENLSLSQAALIAGIIKAPSYYSPRRHLARAISRRNIVLSQMLKLNKITPEQYKYAINEKMQIRKATLINQSAPYYVAELKKELEDYISVETASLSGLKVNTGLNLDLQNCAENAVANQLQNLSKQNAKYKNLEAGFVSIEPFSGKIKAWVGGSNFRKTQFDHVNQAKRQIGSTIKPFLYLTALDRSRNNYRVATALSILSDEPMKIDLVTNDQWVPENYDKTFRGDVTLRKALEQSLNMPAIYISQRVGINAIAATVEQFKLGAKVPRVPALALGAMETRLLDLTTAYAALANLGIYRSKQLFSSVLDHDNKIIAQTQPIEIQVSQEGPVYVLTNIMQGVIDRGTAKSIRAHGFYDQAAGKTGSSDRSRDAWFVGFTPNLVSGVWLGFDDDSETGLTGGQAAAPIWADYMNCAKPFHEKVNFSAPSSVIELAVDLQSGQQATENCPKESIVREVFVKGTEPYGYCKLHPSDHSDLPNSRSDKSARPARRGFWETIFGK